MASSGEKGEFHDEGQKSAKKITDLMGIEFYREYRNLIKKIKRLEEKDDTSALLSRANKRFEKMAQELEVAEWAAKIASVEKSTAKQVTAADVRRKAAAKSAKRKKKAVKQRLKKQQRQAEEETKDGDKRKAEEVAKASERQKEEEKDRISKIQSNDEVIRQHEENPEAITKEQFEELQVSMSDMSKLTAGKHNERFHKLLDKIQKKNRLPRVAQAYKNSIAELLPAADEDTRAVVTGKPHVINPETKFTEPSDGLLIHIPKDNGGREALGQLQDAIASFEKEEGVHIEGRDDVTGLHVHALEVHKMDGHKPDDFEITMRFVKPDTGTEHGIVRIRGPKSRRRLREWTIPVERRGSPADETLKYKHGIRYGNIPEDAGGTSLQRIAYEGGQLHQSIKTGMERVATSTLWGGRKTRKRRKKRRTRRRKKKRGRKIRTRRRR